jgi:hypothetical protein
MNRRKISEQTSLPELAALVSEALERAGITATLSGGAAVSIYSENRYLSEDLDFVTAALVNELEHALEPLGFRHKGRPRLSVFEHLACRWYLEFPPVQTDDGFCQRVVVGIADAATEDSMPTSASRSV